MYNVGHKTKIVHLTVERVLQRNVQLPHNHNKSFKKKSSIKYTILYYEDTVPPATSIEDILNKTPNKFNVFVAFCGVL